MSKKCPKCQQVKDRTAFPKGGANCNACNNERNRKAYKENPHAAQMSRDRVRKFRQRKKDNE